MRAFLEHIFLYGNVCRSSIEKAGTAPSPVDDLQSLRIQDEDEGLAWRKGFDAVLLELYPAVLEPQRFSSALQDANAHSCAVTTGIDGMGFDEEKFRPTGFSFDSELDPGAWSRPTRRTATSTSILGPSTR